MFELQLSIMDPVGVNFIKSIPGLFKLLEIVSICLNNCNYGLLYLYTKLIDRINSKHNVPHNIRLYEKITISL